MAKFNTRGTRPAVSSPITSEATPTGRTHEGGVGYKRDVNGELFLLAVSNLVGENSFYESAKNRDDRYSALVRSVALHDPVWGFEMARWLRSTANMRSASVVFAAEFVKARVDAGVAEPEGWLKTAEVGINRAIVDAVLQRPDEPGELIGYWFAKYGKKMPIALKRGIADAVARLYNERTLLKYDGVNKAIRFGDVIELVNPRYNKKLHGTWRDDLYRYAIESRHNRPREMDGWSVELPKIFANHQLRQRVVEDPSVLLNPNNLRAAGMTWEDALSLAGNKVDKAKLWEALIPGMGYMALLRNLRNFDEAGVSDKVAKAVADLLSDEVEVTGSRQFPFRFLAAYNANKGSLRWAWALEQALNHSVANVPALKGRTLILVDRSASMFNSVSKKSGLNFADSAAIFGTALALRAEQADLVQFGSSHRMIKFRKGNSILPLLSQYDNLGGTNTAQAVRLTYSRHDRVVIITDEQTAYYFYGDPAEHVPANVPMVTFNLVGYEHGHAFSGTGNRVTIGGLTDQAFKILPLLEQSRDGAWPWEIG